MSLSLVCPCPFCLIPSHNHDVAHKDFPEQGKMTLTADIKYKSNWQQAALKGAPDSEFLRFIIDCLVDVVDLFSSASK
jgi:hypothetical protein